MIKKLSLYTLTLLGCLILFNSCKKEYESIATIDQRSIEDYIAKNNITAIKDPSGFYYQIIDVGSGPAVANTDSIYYTYDFKHASGVSIVKSPEYQIPSTFLGYAGNFSFLKNVDAIRLTLAKIKKGGSARVILPSSMAFGKNGSTSLGVESNEIIVIDLGLLNYNNRVDLDNYLLNKFIAANNLQTTLDPSRIRYIVSAEGTNKGDVKATSKITAKYTGRLLNGTVFDSSTDGVEFDLDGGVIAGWTKVIPGKIGVGGKIRLLIPSDLAYGKSSQTDASGNVVIPPYACLDFDIEIVSVKN